MAVWTFFAALFSAALAAMGVGGGGLLVIFLSVFVGFEQHKAQGVNLMFFVFSSLSSLPIHLKYRKIHWQIVVIFWVFGAIGTIFGAKLSLIIDGGVLRRCFGGLLVFASALTVFGVFRSKRQEIASADEKSSH